MWVKLNRLFIKKWAGHSNKKLKILISEHWMQLIQCVSDRKMTKARLSKVWLGLSVRHKLFFGQYASKFDDWSEYLVKIKFSSLKRDSFFSMNNPLKETGAQIDSSHKEEAKTWTRTRRRENTHCRNGLLAPWETGYPAPTASPAALPGSAAAGEVPCWRTRRRPPGNWRSWCSVSAARAQSSI